MLWRAVDLEHYFVPVSQKLSVGCGTATGPVDCCYEHASQTPEF